jgi:hypothetical protein
MIADAHPDLGPHHPRPVRDTDEWLLESATEFCAALNRWTLYAVEKIELGELTGIHACRHAGKCGLASRMSTSPTPKMAMTTGSSTP